MKAPILESERLIYKPLSLGHLSQNYVNWMNSEVAGKYIITAGDYTLQKLKIFLQETEVKQILFWAIHLKENNNHIGNIKIDPISHKHGLCEYGIFMGAANEWGKGYGKEASKTIINYCFDVLNLRKMTLGVVQNNIAAVKLYENLGFTIEGIYKNQEFHDGKYCDTLRMALFNANYKDK